MPKNTETTVNPADLLRDMDALGSKAGEAMDQLLAQRHAILESAQAKAKELDAQIQRLNELYKSANGRYYIPPASTDAGAKSRRPYRHRAELEAYAKEIIAFIASKSPKAVSGAEIKERFPNIPNAGIRAFVQKYAGVQLRDNGERGTARHYLPPA
jgi:hypothetical protein